MPLVLLERVTIAGQSLLLPPSVVTKLNDLFAAWNEVERQRGYVLPKRLNKATYWRARYDDAVRP